jgi:hypothetical protein
MKDLICPFSTTLVKKDFGCRQAHPIIRRGGAEIACADSAAHSRCGQLHQCMKNVALPEFDVADDLLEIPHGVQVKIQYGGLTGLQRITHNAAEQAASVEDIDALVQAAINRYSAVETIPCADFLDDITSWKLPRRRNRRSGNNP